jgi:hypothetical protein
LERAVEIGLCIPGFTAIVVRVVVVRIQVEGLGVIVERTVEGPFGLTGKASIAEGVAEVGLESNGFVVEADLFVGVGAGEGSLVVLLGGEFFSLDGWGGFRGPRCSVAACLRGPKVDG